MKKYLLTPGPSPVPQEVLRVLGEEIIHHRTDEFRSVLADVHTGLKKVFCTKNPVVVFSSSGTGAMEAAVSNFLSGGDKVIVVVGGKFGKRWSEICHMYGVEVVEYNIEWGEAPSPGEIKELLSKDSQIKAVFTTLCETSTATVYDIEGIGRVVKDSEAILVVDAISGLGQDKLLTDEWEVDVVVGGSQKGLMLPPGLSFISVSEKAKELLKEAGLPRYYFNLGKALKSYEKNDTPFTPAVSLIKGLAVALKLILDEGVEKRWRRFEHLAYATREAIKSMGLSIFSRRPSASVTAVVSPSGIKSSELVKKLRKELGLSIAGGQEALKDKIFRIAHMGWIDAHQVLIGLSLLERVLGQMGFKIKPGSALARFQEVYYGEDTGI